ncbi:MAG: hypothetical protein P1U89_19090 [Verrucomicrobiales bacterium]|nr:hypothetical protein [Verrucomicrobiales bacterium]
MRIISILLYLIPALTLAGDPRIALDSEFPAPGKAKMISGEITLIEHVNRRGILRPDRDGTINKYYWDLPHSFEMLPYGSIYYHGAPAELKDIPIGTHLHGQFHLGPEGPFEVTPPVSNYAAGKMARPDLRSVESQYSRAMLLEDDFSFYTRNGITWEIKNITEDRGEIVVEKSGDDESMTLRIDRGTRVWKDKSIASRDDLAVGQKIVMNLGWGTLLGSYKQDALCREIWIDEASRLAATDVQRGIHIEHQKRRGVPALVIKTEHDPGKGAKGWLTAQLYEGIDPELLEELKNAKSVLTQCVEPSLRMYNVNTSGSGRVESVTEIENPPPGCSGIELRIHFYEMQEGHRKGRTIRIAERSWFRPVLPREELLRPNDLRAFSVEPKYITGRDLPNSPQ